jgi:hypothetical protein
MRVSVAASGMSSKYSVLHLKVEAKTEYGQVVHVSGSSFTMGYFNPNEVRQPRGGPHGVGEVQGAKGRATDGLWVSGRGADDHAVAVPHLVDASADSAAPGHPTGGRHSETAAGWKAWW